jgi:phosphate transport system substrate-binding protein
MSLFFRLLAFAFFVLVAVSAAIHAPALAADDLGDICLKDGRILRGRIEIRDGKSFVSVPGSSTPMDLTGQISSTNNPDDPVCKSPAGNGAQTSAPLKFGICGSNTIGERLMPMLIEDYSKKFFGAPPTVKIVEPEHQIIEIKRPNATQPAAIIDFQAKGSGTAPKALETRNVQVAMMSRRMKPEEAAGIKEKQNVEVLQPDSEHVVALDGVAVIVNASNPIRKLTLDQIARIFSGELKNWRDVRGKNENNQDVVGQDGPIKIYARDDKSGTYDTFKSLVMLKSELVPGALRYESSEELSAAVSKNAGAIGFIGFPYINDNHALRISSPCGIDSEPENFSVKMETYPLARRLFLYTLGTPPEGIVRNLVDYALSDGAQQTVVEAGFIDQTVEYQQADAEQRWFGTWGAAPAFALPGGKEIPSQAVGQFARASSGMRRVSIVFRFERGESVLDTLARQNVGRLGRYLAQPAQLNRKVSLVGFADSDGGWASNAALASARAGAVANELRSLGLRLPEIQQANMSYMAPVACNDTDLGRKLNRRVEVWISK